MSEPGDHQHVYTEKHRKQAKITLRARVAETKRKTDKTMKSRWNRGGYEMMSQTGNN